MQIIDTIVLLAYLDEKDTRSQRATEYVFDIGLRTDLFVPSATMHELDLEIKAHRIRYGERPGIYSRLTRLLPQDRILPSTPLVLRRASELTKMATWRSSYFDTLIAATGLEFGADSVVTTDRKFAKLGLKPIF
jgi:predicted nucleic-acid-binding protein